jgi:hypothetical protein
MYLRTFKTFRASRNTCAANLGAPFSPLSPFWSGCAGCVLLGIGCSLSRVNCRDAVSTGQIAVAIPRIRCHAKSVQNVS